MRGEEAAVEEEEEEVVVCGAEVGRSCQTSSLNRDVIYCWTLISRQTLKDTKNYIAWM